MNEVITIGVDLAKNVFQVHGVDAEGIMASGQVTAPRKQAGHMAAPTSSASPSKKTLPTGSRPHMAMSGSEHGHALEFAMSPQADVQLILWFREDMKTVGGSSSMGKTVGTLYEISGT